MKRILLRTAALCAVALTWSAASAQAQGLPSPGPEHEVLKQLEGEWTATVKMNDSESPGTMSAKVECGGLWLVSDFHSDFGGMKFHGRGLDGYDPVKKKYQTVWVDSMSTLPLLMEGDYDKEKKVLTLVGQGPGPDGTPMKYKSLTMMTDKDKHSFKMLAVGSDGKESLVLTIEYARKK